MNTSSGDNGAIEIHRTICTHAQAKPVISSEHIGDYTTPHGEKMSFFYLSAYHETPIVVQLNNNENIELIPLWMEEMNENRHNDFLIPLVRKCLHDKNLRPVHCKIENKVRFLPIHPKDKHPPCWILQNNRLTLSKKITLFVCQSNGCVRYVNQNNQIIVWDSKDGTRREYDLIAESKITALVEQNCNLIVGCKNGNIFIPNFGWICPKKRYIVDIVVIGCCYFAVKYDDKSVIVINDEGVVSYAFSDPVLGIWSVRDRFLVALVEETVRKESVLEKDTRKSTIKEATNESALERTAEESAILETTNEPVLEKTMTKSMIEEATSESVVERTLNESAIMEAANELELEKAMEELVLEEVVRAANELVLEKAMEELVFEEVAEESKIKELVKESVLKFLDITKLKLERVHEKRFPTDIRKDIIVVSDTICIYLNDELSIWIEDTSWTTLKKEKFFSIWKAHRGFFSEKNYSGCFKWKSSIEKVLQNEESSWNDLIRSIEKKTFVFLSPGTFLFPQYPIYDVICVTYFSTIFTAEPPVTFHSNGKWGVTDMIPLTDGSIMYATASELSGIHVVTKDGKLTFSKCEEATRQENLTSLKEMKDGSVAFVSSSYSFYSKEFHINFITPRRSIIPSKMPIDKINTLKSKLASNPIDLNSYDELAKVYLPSDNSNIADHHFAYQIYLVGLKMAAQIGDLYRARRFYEKAKNVSPDPTKLMRLFLSYLKQLPRNKLENNIKLELGILENFENKPCKKRLFIGEGDFSYTESLIKKHIHTHRKLSQAIVATELESKDETNDEDEVIKRIEWLKKRGVEVVRGVDGTKIDEHPVLKKYTDGKLFKRVHWNCPFGDPRDRESFRAVIPKFFECCEKIQSIGDRVHVTLMQGWENSEWYERRQYENSIVKGSVECGYRLVRKRRFGKERYSNYVHTQTDGSKYSLTDVAREFVFEKTSKNDYNKNAIEEKIIYSSMDKKMQDLLMKKYDKTITTDEESLYSTLQQKLDDLSPKEKIKHLSPIENDEKKYSILVNNKNYDGSFEVNFERCYIVCSSDEDSSDYDD